MKKYLLIGLLLLAMTFVACGTDETKDTDVNNPVKDQAEVEVSNDTVEPEVDTEESLEPDKPVEDTEVSENLYKGIDMKSTLPGKEWIQTTFPGVIDTPKIVIYNDETNRKTIVEKGDVVVYNESDTFAVYLPDGYTIIRGSYLSTETLEGENYLEETFDMEIVKEEYEFWKNVDGGAQYKITVDNMVTEEVLTCIISLGD